MDLMSAGDAKFLKTHPEMMAARIVHVETRGVTFERNTGIARTSEPITFRLPNGTGEAKGVEYYANEGRLQLQRDVRFDLVPAGSESGKPTHAEQVEIRGSHLEFDRNSRVMRLSGPAQAVTAVNQLRGGAFLVELDESFRARKLVANAGGGGARP